MKKILSLLLLCALFLLSLSSCSFFGGGHAGPTELGEEDIGLIRSLSGYLSVYHSMCHEQPDTSIAIKINQIKKGYQPLLVEFDTAVRYYVCGYYAETHSGETDTHCCSMNYTWVRYEKEGDIWENYHGKDFMVAFQLNPAVSVRDIRPVAESTPTFEHMMIYQPDFRRFYNAAPPIEYDTPYIYMNDFYYGRREHLRYAPSEDYADVANFPCVEIDGEVFITTPLSYVQSTGESGRYRVRNELGEYYDALNTIMVRDRYSVMDEKGVTRFYGLFSVEEFSEAVLK